MWKVYDTNIFEILNNDNKKVVNFTSEEKFLEFIRILFNRTGLDIPKKIWKKYKDRLCISLMTTETTCKEKGYMYGTIERYWKYKFESIETVSQLGYKIIFDTDIEYN